MRDNQSYTAPGNTEIFEKKKCRAWSLSGQLFLLIERQRWVQALLWTLARPWDSFSLSRCFSALFFVKKYVQEYVKLHCRAETDTVHRVEAAGDVCLGTANKHSEGPHRVTQNLLEWIFHYCYDEANVNNGDDSSITIRTHSDERLQTYSCVAPPPHCEHTGIFCYTFYSFLLPRSVILRFIFQNISQLLHFHSWSLMNIVLKCTICLSLK